MQRRDPKGSRNKYEYDPELGAIKLDRFVSASVVYPTDYGYALAPTGDRLGVLLCVSEPSLPGNGVSAKPIGLLRMADEKGPGAHVVSVPATTQTGTGRPTSMNWPLALRAHIRPFLSIDKDPDPDRQSGTTGGGGRQTHSRRSARRASAA